jgi:hypothetical protein
MEQERKRESAAGAALVVVLECVAGSSKAEEWGGGGGVVQEGDVVESVRVGVGSAAASLDAPFKGGRAALHKALHAAFKRGDTSVEVRARRPAHRPARQQQQLEMDSSGELVSPTSSEASVETTTTRMQACIVPQVAAAGGGGG